MKKIILLVIILLFSVISANAATVSVRYNVAGAPVSVTNAAGIPMTIRQAYNAYGYRPRPIRPARLAAPVRPIIPAPRHPAIPYGYRTRYAQAQQPPLMNLLQAPVQPVIVPQQTSRLDRNYNVTIPRKTHSENGVTYYN